MNRRRFALAGGLVSVFSTVCREGATARGIDGVSRTAPAFRVQGLEESAFTDAPGLVLAVHRVFEASQAGFMDILAGTLIIAAGYGAEFESPVDASRAIDFLAESLVETFTEDVEGTPGSVIEASVGRLGDERLGLATMIELDDDEFYEEVVIGTVFVRKDRFLQVLVGGSTMGPLSQLAQISTSIDPRWPSNNVWDIVPELADMPVGMVLDSEDEYASTTLGRGRESIENEGSSDADDRDELEIETGSLTFSVELRVSGLYLKEDATSNSCSGAGFYAVAKAGSEFKILDSDTDELLYSTILSPGTLEESSCAWRIAVLGLPPRSKYEFFVGLRRLGAANFEDIQQGEIVRFDKDK